MYEIVEIVISTGFLILIVILRHSFNATGSTWFIERLECVFSRQPCKGKIVFFGNFNCCIRKVEVHLCPFLVLAS